MAAYETAGETDEWYTPKYIFDALGETFDLDVASPPGGPRYVPASDWLCLSGDTMPWHGFVWMNPPFGHQRTKRTWLRRFFAHGDGIALVPDRTSAPWFQEFAPLADAILWVSPKIKFERPDGSIGESPGTGTALLAAGERAKAALFRATSLGFVSIPSAIDAPRLSLAGRVVEPGGVLAPSRPAPFIFGTAGSYGAIRQPRHVGVADVSLNSEPLVKQAGKHLAERSEADPSVVVQGSHGPDNGGQPCAETGTRTTAICGNRTT